MKKIIIIVVILTVLFVSFFINKNDNIMINLSSYSKEKIEEYAKDNNLKLKIIYEESNEDNKFISQSILPNKKFKDNDELIVTFSKINLEKEYEKYKVNELGNIPIMMYHNIIDVSNTSYIGGNVDKYGYSRTKEAFINDLEMYYKNGYRMIRLTDYIDGNIDVEMGKSPIILTFDDGNNNNIKVIEEDENGNIVIDPNSAVGILESFKNKYKDFNITATFFLNEGLFNQPKYNEKILKWLIKNGYDIGNHTYGHIDFSKIDINETQKSIALIYSKLNDIIENSYINVISLPYGSPYSKEHDNYKYIVNGEFNNFKYETKGILRVGWDSNPSPFSKNFDPLFMKRVRAYDNLGKEFDIEMVFKQLESTRYISDGDKLTIVTKDIESLNDSVNKKVIKY